MMSLLTALLDQSNMNLPPNMLAMESSAYWAKLPIKVSLTSREKEILKLIKKGVLSKEISDQLLISLHTVNTYRQRILEKLGFNNSMEVERLPLKSLAKNDPQTGPALEHFDIDKRQISLSIPIKFMHKTDDCHCKNY